MRGWAIGGGDCFVATALLVCSIFVSFMLTGVEKRGRRRVRLLERLLSDSSFARFPRRPAGSQEPGRYPEPPCRIHGELAFTRWGCGEPSARLA